MPVTPNTLADLNALAKDYWTDVYVPLMNTDTPLKNQFTKLEGATFTGRKWIFGAKASVGGGASNAGANKTLPAPDTGNYAQGEAQLVRTYVRMSLDGFAIEVTKKQQGSYRPALAETMADRLQAHDLERNRQMFCGGNGKLALVGVGANSATQTMASDYGVTGGGNGTRHIYDGDQLAFYSADGLTLRGRRTVISHDPTAQTVVLDSPITTTTADFASKSTADDDNKSAGEANGLLASVSDAATAFEVINPVAVPRWKAIRLANAGVGREVSDTLVMTMIARLRSESRLTPNLVVTRPGIVLKYSETFLPLRRLDGQDVQLKGGYKPLTAIIHAGGAIPVMDDLDCPDGRMFFLNTSSMKMADIIGSEWADMDGAQFTRVTDKDAIEGYIRSYWNLITVQRNCNGLLEDLNDIPSIDRLAA